MNKSHASIIALTGFAALAFALTQAQAGLAAGPGAVPPAGNVVPTFNGLDILPSSGTKLSIDPISGAISNNIAGLPVIFTDSLGIGINAGGGLTFTGGGAITGKTQNVIFKDDGSGTTKIDALIPIFNSTVTAGPTDLPVMIADAAGLQMANDNKIPSLLITGTLGNMSNALGAVTVADDQGLTISNNSGVTSLAISGGDITFPAGALRSPTGTYPVKIFDNNGFEVGDEASNVFFKILGTGSILNPHITAGNNDPVLFNDGVTITAPGSLDKMLKITDTNGAAGAGSYIYFDTVNTDWTIGAKAPATSWDKEFAIRDYGAAQDRLVIDSAGNVGIGTNAPASKLEVDNATASTYVYLAGPNDGVDSYGTTYGVYGSALGTGVYGYAPQIGVRGWADNANGTGVYGSVSSATGANYGVYGSSDSSQGYGVVGKANSLSGTNYGLYGSTASSAGYGVYGTNNSGTAIYGISSGTAGGNAAVVGMQTGTSGATYGVYGANASSSGSAVYGTNSSTGYGGNFRNNSTGTGLYATNTGTGAAAIFEKGNVGIGTLTPWEKLIVYTSPSNWVGLAAANFAVYAQGPSYGVYGSGPVTGVYGQGGTYGLQGQTSVDSGIGLWAGSDATTGNGIGVYGRSQSSNGYGGSFANYSALTSPVNSTALRADSANGYGVMAWGISANAIAGSFSNTNDADPDADSSVKLAFYDTASSSDIAGQFTNWDGTTSVKSQVTMGAETYGLYSNYVAPVGATLRAAELYQATDATDNTKFAGGVGLIKGDAGRSMAGLYQAYNSVGTRVATVAIATLNNAIEASGSAYFTGKVGVGTTSPTSMLTVVSSSGGAAAIGSSTTVASGAQAVALGFGAKATGDYSTATGVNSNASGYGSVASGYTADVSGNYAIGIGYNANTSGLYGLALGQGATASSQGATSIGYNSSATNVYATALGTAATASDQESLAMGYYATASGANATAAGIGTTASGDQSTAMGYYTTATGTGATALGYKTTAQSYMSTVVGSFNSISGTTNSWVSTDPIFVVGNGSLAASPSNAMTVLKNGQVNATRLGMFYEVVTSAFNPQDGASFPTKNVDYQLNTAGTDATGSGRTTPKAYYVWESAAARWVLKMYCNAGDQYISMLFYQSMNANNAQYAPPMPVWPNGAYQISTEKTWGADLPGPATRTGGTSSYTGGILCFSPDG